MYVGITIGIGPPPTLAGTYCDGVCGVCGREAEGVLGDLGVNGFALGLKTNSLAFGLSVDFFKVSVTLLIGSGGEGVS